jgi:parallel beta-helix repeat protein
MGQMEGVRTRWKLTRLLALGLVFILLFPMVPPSIVRASPGTLYVPSSQYPTIQSAITAAATGDTIIVSGGVYAENVVVNKTLVLTGAGNSSTFIDGRGIGPGVSVVAASGVTISGFTIRNPGLYNSSFLVISSSKITLSSSVLVGSAKQSNGTTIYNSNGVSVIHTAVTGNLYGIAIQGGFNNMIQDDNSTGNTIGMGIFNSAGNTAKLNILRYGSEGVRIWYPGSTGNLVIRNLIANNSRVGISMLNSTGNRIIGNEVAFNNGQPTSEGISLQASTGNKIYYNNIRNNTIQMYAVYGGDMTGNTWNDGAAKLKGNFWSNYNGTDADNDGIGDTQLPWPCPRGGPVCSSTGLAGVDYYPLMKPWTYSSLVVAATAQPSSGCPLVLNVTFSGSAKNGVPVVRYYWNFGDGSSLTGQNVTHLYSVRGTLFPTLTVIDSVNSNGTDIVPITVFAGGLTLRVASGQTSVSGANITFTGQPPGRKQTGQLTNPQGIAAFPCLAPGPYTIQVSRPGYVTGRASFAVTNQTVNLTVTLAPVPASSFPVVFLVAGGVAVALAVLLVGFFVFRRRKKDRA